MNTELINRISFTTEQYEAKTQGTGYYSFEKFIDNIVVSVTENNGDIQDAIFIAEDAFAKL